MLRNSARTLFTAPTRISGTVGEHTGYLFLRSKTKPTEFPVKTPTTPLYSNLSLSLAPHKTLVNWAWYPEEPSSALENEEESYEAVLFDHELGQIDIPHTITNANWSEVVDNSVAGKLQPLDTDTIHLYVCTHGARDCKCGDFGMVLVDALRAEIQKRGGEAERRVNVAEVGHVGGHKHAANMLVYPHGDWYGYVEPEHVPKILDILLQSQNGHDALRQHFWATWRGRMGLSKEQQQETYKLLSESQTSPLS